MSDNILKYKTRGTSKPDKKPKVYFCCHTSDLKKHFDAISDDILKSQNCSIWYMESVSLPIDDRTMFDLEQMHLFVVPVTYRILTDDKDPANEILQYALRYNIPVLHIIVEFELEHLFEKKFGNIQYLNRVDTDQTAIHYSDKLSKHLSKMLTSDDEAEVIRSAFHAYIFLSYRKKDREFAQRLMKKIHENKSCESVAIWYDEFLVPGENFEEEIRKTLEKSRLFSLAITPNIVNEENYVMNKEYPMAQELNKMILSVEMIPTDKDMLQECYPNIPEPVSILDEVSLHDKLRDIFPEISNSEENNANRKFLNGRAYLSGIDVELDREKGVNLIEQAAEAGVEDAIRKLVEIYSTGNGSAKNFEKAYQWEERLLKRYWYVFEKSGNDRDIMPYLNEVMNYIDMVKENDDTDKALALCEKAYEISMEVITGKGKTFFKRISCLFKRKDEYFDEALFYLLKSCRLALKFSLDMDIREIVEKWLNKVVSLLKSYEWYKKLFDGTVDLKELFAVYHDLSDIVIKNEKYDEAKLFIEKMSVVLTELSDTEDSVDFRRHQVLISQKEGELAQATADLVLAHTAQQKCIDLLLEIAGEYPEDIANITHLIRAQNRLGTIYCKEQDAESAEKWLAASQISIRDLKDRGHDFENKPIYAQVMVLSGDIFFLRNDNENALASYNEAYKIFSRIADDTNTVSAPILRDLATVLQQIGRCYERLGRHDEAEQWYRQSEDAMNNVRFVSRSVIDARVQADICEHLWNNAIYRKDYVSEREWYGKLLFVREETVRAWDNEYDKGILNVLIRNRERLKKEGKIGSIDWNAPSNFIQYIRKHPVEYNENTQAYIEMEIGGLLEKYWKVHFMHMDDRTSTAFTRLTLILTRNEGYYDKMKEDEIEGGKLRYSNIVLDFLLKNNNAFTRYDECAVLISNFCGYYAIDYSNVMVGGKKQGMKDFWNYYGGEAFWTMHVQKIKYLDLWMAIHSWIMATKHKYDR